MREIRFRAWDIGAGQMIKNVSIPFIGGWLGNNVTSSVNGLFRDTAGRLEWMQFTGLKDKNGIEIYEGDIVNYWPTLRPDEQSLYKVKFNTGRFLLVKTVLDVRAMFVCGKYEQCEVVGSIYENPELLEQPATAEPTTEKTEVSEVK